MMRLRLLRFALWPALVLPAVAAFDGARAQEAAAPEADTAARLERIERLLSNQGLVRMLQQLEAMQQEMERLRGELETQSHLLEQIKKQQRDLYADLDERLRRLQAAPPRRVAAFDPAPGAEDEMLDPLYPIIEPLGAGAFSREEALPPPGTGAFSREEALPPLDTGAFSREEALPPPDTGAFPQEQALPPPDTGALPQEQALSGSGAGTLPQEQALSGSDTAAFPQEQALSGPGTGAFPQEQALAGSGAAAFPQEQALPPPGAGALPQEQALSPPDADTFPQEAAWPPLGVGRPAPPAPSDPEQARAEYRRAFDLLKRARYQQAVPALRAFLARHGTAEQAPDARFWLAEAYYVNGRFDLALEEYSRLLQDHPDSRKAAQAQLKAGFCLYELGRMEQAGRRLEEAARQHPGTTVARLAEERLREIRAVTLPDMAPVN